MKCPNRAAERRPEVIQVLRQAGYERVIDMSGHEKRDKAYFEGTGAGLAARLLLCGRGKKCAEGVVTAVVAEICATRTLMAPVGHASAVSGALGVAESWCCAH
jgi:hypothetical protein